MRRLSVFYSAALMCVTLSCGGTQEPQVSFGGMGAAGSIGSECVVDEDCGTGFCDRTVPGGYCSALCDDETPCDAGAYCQDAGGQGFCMQTCTSPRACRDGRFLCYTVIPDELGVCAMDLEVITPSAPNIGAACTASVECAAPNGLEPFCVPQVNLSGGASGFPDGMCIAIGCEPGMCGEGAVCLPASSPYCAPSCDATEDCREGYLCDATAGACVPR